MTDSLTKTLLTSSTIFLSFLLMNLITLAITNEDKFDNTYKSYTTAIISTSKMFSLAILLLFAGLLSSVRFISIIGGVTFGIGIIAFINSFMFIPYLFNALTHKRLNAFLTSAPC